jgi:hypothetical protein
MDAVIPVLVLVLWIYSTIGLGAGAAFFSYDTHKDYNNAKTSSFWTYLIGQLLVWPIAAPLYIVDTVNEQKRKQVSQEEREQAEAKKWDQRNITHVYASDLQNGNSYVRCEKCGYHFNWATSNVAYFAQKHSRYEHNSLQISIRRE